jgi:hypothetical protein
MLEKKFSWQINLKFVSALQADDIPPEQMQGKNEHFIYCLHKGIHFFRIYIYLKIYTLHLHKLQILFSKQEVGSNF